MKERSTQAVTEFSRALEAHETDYGIELTAPQREAMCDYYDILIAWNARLHLVAPCSPTEFATRHILESLFALPFIPTGARLCDVGSGGGLPVVPCAIMRPDLSLTLIESNAKKSIFLREALTRVGRMEQSNIINARFENINVPPAELVTCRALDRFAEMFDKLIAWTPRESTMLLFGGNKLGARIAQSSLVHREIQIPRSSERFIFIIQRSSAKS